MRRELERFGHYVWLASRRKSEKKKGNMAERITLGQVDIQNAPSVFHSFSRRGMALLKAGIKETIPRRLVTVSSRFGRLLFPS